MTSPDQLAPRLATAASLVGTDKPQLAHALATSSLNDSELRTVGGYVDAMQLAVANRLATESGAQTNFTGAENTKLDGVGEQTKAPTSDSRSFLEQALDGFSSVWSNTGNFLLHNPVTGAIEKAGNWLGNVAHMPFRLLSSALDTSNDDEVDREMRADGYDPNNTSSYLAFMWSQGENLYHDLGKARITYGDDMVDAVIQVQRDPQGYYDSLLKTDPAAAAKLKTMTNTPEFQKAYDAVDQRHISPGRDLARVLTLGHTNNGFFTALSGTLDAAYDWFTDPTLIAGKAGTLAHALDVTTGALQGESAAARFLPSHLAARAYDFARGGAQRAGIQSMVDQGGIEKLLATDAAGQATTAVGRGWQQFLSDAKDLRAAHAKAIDTSLTPAARADAAAQRAGIYRAMGNRYGVLMPLLDDVNGTRKVVAEAESTGGKIDSITTGRATGGVVTAGGKPIETLPELSKYLVSTNGLLALHNGMAARRAIVMPGRLAPWAERKVTTLFTQPKAAGDTWAAKRAAAKAKWIDYSDPRLLPTDGDQPILSAMEAAGQEQNKLVAKSALGQLLSGHVGTAARVARAKADRVSRRFTTLVPTVTHVDLNDAGSGQLVEQIGRMYLNKGDAARLASAYQLGDLATRRQMVKGVLTQGMHAAGLSKSADGLTFMRKFLGELDGDLGGTAVRQKYGLGDTSLLRTARGPVEGALYPDQLSSKVLIPSMRELNHIATKLSVSGFARRTGIASVHSFAQSDSMDKLLGVIKMGWITTAAGGLRNALDEVVNFGTYGIGREALAGRVAFSKATRTMREQRIVDSKEYARLRKEQGLSREGLDDQLHRRVGEALVSHDSAKRALDKATSSGEGLDEAQTGMRAAAAELKKARGLETAIRYRVPLALRGLADNTHDLLITPALGKLLSVFGEKYKITDEVMKYASELTDHELAQVLREGVFQSHYVDSGAMLASDDHAMDLHRSGLMARKYAYRRIYDGWGEVEPDGGSGLDAWAKYLQLRFADPSSPAHSWIQTVRALGGHDGVTPQILDAAKASVRARVDEEDLRHFVANAEVFRQTRAGDLTEGNDALLAKAKDEYADRVSADLVQGLAHAGDGGPTVHHELLDMLADGVVPDRSWLANHVPTGNRPEKTIGQLWAPYNPAHEPGGFPKGYTGFMTKAYGKVVTDQINALSRNPLVTALYVNARRNTAPYEKALVEAGWGKDAAAEVAKRISLTHAQDEALKHIDNPYVASQFSLLSRNYFAFVRAQEDWLRRWGRTLKDNPQLIRQAQLLIHGGQSVGFVQKDDQNQLEFVYPGSQLALDLFGKLFGIAGQANQAKVPMQGELTSQLMFLNPSLDNPIGLSATPLLSLPLKALTHFLGPDHQLLASSLDQAANGQLGAGRQWYEQMLPSWANRILSGLISDAPGSKFGAAMTQSLAHMEAAGQLDDPKLQTPTGKANFYQQLSAGIRNNLAFTALFGAFAPAAPSLDPTAQGAGPESAGKAGTGDRPDWLAHLTGLRSLKDEARDVLSKLPYEQALAWWQKVHPGELIYVEGGGRTEVGTPKASAPATIAAAEHIEQNSTFYGTGAGGYGGKGGIAAYFIPQGQAGTKDGEYSDVAYRAQLEAGIRDYKSLSDYFDDVVVARGESAYYTAKDQYDAKRAQLINSGDRAGAQRLDNEWALQKQELNDANPLLAQKQALYAADNAASSQSMNQLYQLANDTSASTVKALGANRAGVVALLQAYEAYQAGVAQLADSRTNAANRAKQDLKDTYTTRVQELAGGPTAQFPDLADLARGLFRLPS